MLNDPTINWEYQFSKMQESYQFNPNMRCRIFNEEKKSWTTIHGNYFAPSLIDSYYRMMSSESKRTSFIAVVEFNYPYTALKTYGIHQVEPVVTGCNGRCYPIDSMILRFIIGDPNYLFFAGENILTDDKKFDEMKGETFDPDSEDMSVDLIKTYPDVLIHNIYEAVAVTVKETDKKHTKQLSDTIDLLAKSYKNLLCTYSSQAELNQVCVPDLNEAYDGFIEATHKAFKNLFHISVGSKLA